MDLGNLKRHIFFELLNLVGRVFILVEHRDDVVLGRRYFTDDEKKSGIVLVFNSKMKFDWDDEGIRATLVFGMSPQKCKIPAEAIIAVYSPEAGAQFVVSSVPEAAAVGTGGGDETSHASEDETGEREEPAGAAGPDNVIPFAAAKKPKSTQRSS
jgi:hypothetical protein